MYKNLINDNLKSQSEYLKSILPDDKMEMFQYEEGLVELIPGLKSRSKQNQRTKVHKAMVNFSNTGIIKAEDLPSIEAIILPELRPVFIIKDDTYTHIEKAEWQILNNEKVKNSLVSTFASIGRVEVPTNDRIPYAGTGFLVSENIIMTNRHVAELFCRGLGINGLRFISGQAAGIDFKEEINTALEDHVFFDIKNVLMIHPYWDMSLLEVTVPERYRDREPLSLVTVDPDQIDGRNVAIVGYPAFDPRNDGKAQNRVFGGQYNIKRLQPGKAKGTKVVESYNFQVRAMAHDASTLGGNSGSAVVDLDTGHILGLHFAGKYLESNYAVSMFDLASDKYVRKMDLNFKKPLPKENDHWQPVWDLVNRQESIPEKNIIKPDIINNGPKSKNQVLKCVTEITPEGRLSITIPVNIKTELTGNVNLFNDTKVSTSPKFLPDREGLIGNYEERTGYNIDFLGTPVPLPWLLDELFLQVERNTHATSNRHVLPYTHFSIVMNRMRRLPFYTAVNIDGANPKSLADDMGGSTTWYYDDRISRDAQMGNDYYRDAGGSNPLDRGHIVRRIEPMWGSDLEVAKSHNDTFHWTNCSPQHSRFNKQGFLWAKIENYMLDSAQAENKKISVFSGPVFKDSDPLYMAPAGVQVHIPIEFWKVVVYIHDGELQARGFLLSQETEVNNLIEAFDDNRYSEFQLPLEELEDMIQIQFSNDQMGFDLKPFDAFVNNSREEGIPNRRKLNNLEDIIQA